MGRLRLETLAGAARRLVVLGGLFAMGGCGLSEAVGKFGADEARRLGRVLDPQTSLDLVRRFDLDVGPTLESMRRRSTRLAKWPAALGRRAQRSAAELRKLLSLSEPRAPIQRVRHAAQTARDLLVLHPIGPRSPRDRARAVDPERPAPLTLGDRLGLIFDTYVR